MPKAEIDQRVAEAVEILGLGDLLDRKPRQLSGGQRQRVAMGRAIVRQPAVFLFDEPLSNLDAKLRVQMRAEIAKLHQRLGTTTIYVTHDQVEAMTLAKRIVVMSDGLVMQVGAPLELYRKPANLFVAGFIGSPAMNFFDVKVEDGTVRADAFQLPVPARFLADLGEAGRPLVLGIRPEHMHEARASESDTLPHQVDVLEPLGADVHALGQVGDQFVTARLEPDTRAKVGDLIQLGIDLEEVHLFDKASGKALGGQAP
jgi:multiple sugar transport system ATP-binding protein